MFFRLFQNNLNELLIHSLSNFKKRFKNLENWIFHSIRYVGQMQESNATLGNMGDSAIISTPT